jgi:hypothetical protein
VPFSLYFWSHSKNYETAIDVTERKKVKERKREK